MRRTTLYGSSASSALTPASSMTSYGGLVRRARSAPSAWKRSARKGVTSKPSGVGTSGAGWPADDETAVLMARWYAWVRQRPRVVQATGTMAGGRAGQGWGRWHGRHVRGRTAGRPARRRLRLVRTRHGVAIQR